MNQRQKLKTVAAITVAAAVETKIGGTRIKLYSRKEEPTQSGKDGEVTFGKDQRR